MYGSVVDRYRTTPFAFKPSRTIDNISVPADLFEWLTKSFVEVTFAETAENGDENGFCTKGSLCDIDQGDCDVSSQCNTGLHCADRKVITTGVYVNGNHWEMQDLVDWCDTQYTPINSSATIQVCSTSPTPDGNLGPCCWDYKTSQYITSIRNASTQPLSVTTDVIGRGNCPISIGPASDCCAAADPGPYTEAEITQLETSKGRPSSIANFNRIMHLRFSTKRYKVTQAKGHAAFSHMANLALSSSKRLDPGSDNGGDEDKDPFYARVGADYPYTKEGSYRESGGYNVNINPANGRDYTLMMIYRMAVNGMFDAKMATFVVDTMLYNGNTDTFMYIAFTFSFSPSGTCVMETSSMFCNIMAGSWNGRYAFSEAITSFVLIPLVIIFILREILHMLRASAWVHFVQGFPNTTIDLASLMLCVVVLALKYAIQLQSTYTNMRLKHPHADNDTFQDFKDLVALQDLESVQAVMVAINIFMIFFRAVVMITQLEENLGLIVNTLGVASLNLIYFTCAFTLLISGFVAFAYTTFGSKPDDSGFTTPMIALYMVFSMLLGQIELAGLQRIDEVMALFFFFSFYIMVSFVMINMFISILLSGYDVCIYESQKKKETRKGLFRQIYDEATTEVLGKATGMIIVCTTFLWMQILRPFFRWCLLLFQGLPCILQLWLAS
jgi:hypothetical protein